MKNLVVCWLVLLSGCGGGGGSSDSNDPILPADLVDPAQVRVYQIGDVIEFTGTISTEITPKAAVIHNVVARMEFLNNVYSLQDKNVLALKTTMSIEATGEEAATTIHIWQEANGALFDLNDQYGKYYLNSASNEYGIPSIPVTLMPFDYNEYQFYTLYGGNTSTPITLGGRSLRVGEEASVSVPAGTFVVYPVQRNDSYSYLLSFDDHKRDESIVDEVTHWVSPTRGLVKIQQHYRQYAPVGTLEETVLIELEATAFEF